MAACYFVIATKLSLAIRKHQKRAMLAATSRIPRVRREGRDCGAGAEVFEGVDFPDAGVLSWNALRHVRGVLFCSHESRLSSARLEKLRK